MIKFKAWDWVRDTRQGMKKPITQLKPNCIALTNPEEYAKYYIPWAPEVGEWCWFWNAQAQAPVLGKFLKYDGRLMPFFTMANDCFIFCEPFIGELPSHLKDKK